MFEPLKGLVRRPRSATVEIAEVKVCIESFLRQELASDAVYCEEIVAGQARIRVGKAIDAFQVYALIYDLQQTVATQCDFSLQSVRVIQRS